MATATKSYEVLFPHCRNINGELMMFEPMFSGVVELPDDEETRMAVEAEWLKPVATRSQVQAVGGQVPKSWDDYEKGCLMTFGGGYHTEAEREIFRHGMSTVFNMLRAEFKPAEECKRT